MRNRQIELRMLLMKSKGKETPTEHIAVLVAQLGAYSRGIYHLGAFPEDANLYMLEVKRAIGDMIVQLQIACNHHGLNFDELGEMGYKAFVETMLDIRKSRKAGESH